jgi:carboxypeptidase C (cathepsin A)
LYHSCIAGHYIPATAQIILESNSIYTKNLKGIGIGNGWVDPYIQYAAYAKVRERERDGGREGGREGERARTQSFPLQFAYMEKLINEPSLEIANVMFSMCKGILATTGGSCVLRLLFFSQLFQAFLISICTLKPL